MAAIRSIKVPPERRSVNGKGAWQLAVPSKGYGYLLLGTSKITLFGRPISVRLSP